MTDFGDAQLNLEKILNARLEITQQERVTVKEALDNLDAKIKTLSSRMGIKPKETLEGLTEMMRTLERSHATTTQSKNDERQFMREMEKLKQKKKSLIDYLKSNEELDLFKEKRAALYQEIRDKDKTLDELNYGIRKVRTATKLQCSTAEIIEQKFNFPEDALPRIIGKGGQNLRQIENDFKVSVETERMGGHIRIMGTEDAIGKAYGNIMNTVNTSSVEISPSDETIVCLVLNKAAYLHDLQNRHSVRIDVSRAKKVCKVTGLANSIAAAVVEINLVDSCRNEIEIDNSLLPSIVGKGGAVIRQLEEDHRVQIDILRDENKVATLGFRTDVEIASNKLKSIIVENKEVEDTIKANRHVIITCIIGNGGQTARALQKELSVGIRVDRADDDGDLDTIMLRGITSKVLNAKAHLLQLLKDFYSHTFRVEVPPDCLPLIVGKKGSRINSLREEFPEASIDIEGSTVYIQSSSEKTRLELKSVIENLVSSNYMKSFELHPDIAISLKGQRGADLRTLFASTLELGFEIDNENKNIKLRGTQENVAKGVVALEAFKNENYCDDLICDSDDCLALMSAINETSEIPYKAIESEFNVDIYISRKENLLKIRGTRMNVDNAKNVLQSILDGNIERGSIVMSINKIAFSALIGKGGVTLKKIESDYKIKLDLMKTKNLIRIRSDKECIMKAKNYIRTFLDEIKSTAIVEYDTKVVNEHIVTACIEITQEAYCVEIITTPGNITIKGLIRLVDAAQKYLQNQLSNPSVSEIYATVTQLQHSTFLQALQDIAIRHHTVITSDNTNGIITIKGSDYTKHKDTRKAIIFALQTLFPLEYVALPVSLYFIQDLASHTLDDSLDSTGAKFEFDLILRQVLIRGETNTNSVMIALDMIKNKQLLWGELHPIISIDDYLLPSFVGKNGSSIVQLEKDLQVRIRVNRIEKRLEIENSDDIEIVSKAYEAISAKVEKMRASHWEIIMSPEMLGTFIGKEGVNIKKFRSDTNANIDVDNKTEVLRVTGEPHCVTAAKIRILAFINEEEKNNHVLEVSVPPLSYPVIIGPKGTIAKDIQIKTGCRLELDRNKQIVILRGSIESCQSASTMIHAILEENGFNVKPIVDDTIVDTTEKTQTDSNDITKSKPKVIR